MHPRKARLVVMAMAAQLASCAPSVATLLQRNQVTQAFCRASSEQDAVRVIPAMLAKLRPSWRVREVLPADLRDLDPALAQDILSRYVVLVVERRGAAGSGLALRDLAGVRSAPEGQFAPAGLILGPASFAALTGEQELEPHQETTSHLAHPERAVPWAFMTLGLSLIFADRVTTTETRYPSDAEQRAAAPRSAALHDALLRAFGPSIDVAVIARGAQPHTFQIEDDIFVDNSNGELGEHCDVDAQVEVHGAPFLLGAPAAWPAGDAFREFSPSSWTQAQVRLGHGYAIHIDGPGAATAPDGG